MEIRELIEEMRRDRPDAIEEVSFRCRDTTEILVGRQEIPKLCDLLFHRKDCLFSGLIVEENEDRWDLFYLFVGQNGMGRILLRAVAPLNDGIFESVSVPVHAADWHEREAEDLFGLVFQGHPRLGDFILHDDAWQEGVEPMRNGFDPDAVLSDRKPKQDWRPRRIVDSPGAFVMPIGPVFSGEAESVHFLLETIGEEVIRSFPRLFFKYRGVEKTAEGRSIDEAVLLAERFAGTTAFSHALAFCLAVERLCSADAPERAQILRVFFAELERLRNHIAAIEAVCESTGLAVAANQTAILEEEALRLACALSGHRYLFGLAVPGGLSRDCEDAACKDAVTAARGIVRRLDGIERLLINTSSFLDRIEEVGIVSEDRARDYGMVGPVARGSACCDDIRRLIPYSGYDRFEFDTPCEKEGDGYARLRVLFSEARQSLRIMGEAAASLPKGRVISTVEAECGVALAGVETPRGAAWHWLRIDGKGKVRRYRLITPSFTNWHGFHLAAENFAFQDFPIILATFGLSVAENDR